MKKIFLFFLIFSWEFIFSQKENTILKKYTFEEAYSLQKKEKKPLLVFFHTDWCKHCFTMKKNTFNNKEIIKILNNNFYFISFNAESNLSIEINGRVFKNRSGVHQITEIIASKNGTISYPSTVIISSNNTIDEQIDSFLSSVELKKILNSYIKKRGCN